MNVSVFTVIGVLYCFFKILLPILEALLFGILNTLLIMFAAGKSSLRIKHWWWIVRNPWVKAWSRLFGFNRFTSSQECSKWVHEPPFKLYRKK